MQDVYFISGLGADERVFQFLKVQGYQPRHIYWVQPDENETIENYAKRLIEQIKTEQPILVGLSFGGMIAIEISKWIDVKKVILISSAKNKSEIPAYLRRLRHLPVHRVISMRFVSSVGIGVASWFFGIHTQKNKQLLQAILLDTDSDFLRWAVDKVLTWENEAYPDNIHHIHGTRDRIFPLRFVEPDSIIQGGGHFMIVEQAEQISSWLGKVLN